ncbi:MAG: hypothetical protein AAFY71_14880 [Bacteroidota bacterium]
MKAIKRYELIFLILFIPLGKLMACECEPPQDPLAALEQSTFAVYGKCVLVNTNWMSGGMKYSFQVNQSWKRSTEPLFIVNTPFAEECGGMKFEVGKEYLLFVEKKFSPKTNRCMGTRIAKEADIMALGQGIEPINTGKAFQLLWIISAMILGFSGILIFAILRKRGNKA